METPLSGSMHHRWDLQHHSKKQMSKLTNNSQFATKAFLPWEEATQERCANNQITNHKGISLQVTKYNRCSSPGAQQNSYIYVHTKSFIHSKTFTATQSDLMIVTCKYTDVFKAYIGSCYKFDYSFYSITPTTLVHAWTLPSITASSICSPSIPGS